MTLRLGEMMVHRGLLTEDQVETILAEQRDCGGAFGDIAERMFGLDASDVELLWAEQYASITDRVNPERARIDPDALALVSRRQAAQFRVLPLRVDDGGELVVCTTEEDLPRALRFVYRVLGRPSYFVLADDPESFDRALATHYPHSASSAAAPAARASRGRVPAGHAEAQRATARRAARR